LIEALTLSRFARSHIQPVSRVWFELSDTDSFDRCVKLAVEWMAAEPTGNGHQRSGTSLPNAAWEGQTFDITDEIGANPTKAVRLTARDGNLWAARLDWPEPNFPRTWISEFFVEKRVGRMTRFGAQVTCVKRGESPAFEITRPNVVQRVLGELAAEADNRPLSDYIEISNIRDIPDIVELIYSSNRRLPVIIITNDDNGNTYISPNNISKRVGGSSHIYHLDNDAISELQRTIGKRMSAFNGAVRLYEPGLTEATEDPFAHPLWLKNAKPPGTLIRQITSRVLQAAFLDRSEFSFPRYSTVRDASRREEKDSSHDAPSPQVELEQALNLVNEYAEERDEWHSLALEEQDRRLEAEREVERLKAENIRLENKHRFSKYLSEGEKEEDHALAPPRRLESYEDLEDWAEEVLQDAVYIHQSALKDCKKNGNKNMLELIEKSLLIMKDYMTPARIKNDSQLKLEVKNKLAEIGVEDSACFVDRDEAKRRPQYSINYDGDTRVLFDHLKHGNGYNNAYQFRIYYFWDERNKRHVVGKMPSHLPNNRTN